jgi:LysM domain
VSLSRGKQCALALLIVLAVGAGMLFHRSHTPLAPAEGESRTPLTRRLPSPHPAVERGHLLPSFEEKVPRVPTAATAADPDTRNREFPAHPSGAFHPGSALFMPSDNLAPAEPAHDELLSDAHSPSAAGRTHLVVDGDTLARLAARYLGSSDRYGEIFAANRGVLTKPDLLPIGAELVIPPRQRPAPPVELGPEDTASPAQNDDDAMPRLDLEIPTADGGDGPAVREADASATNEELVPVSKASPAEKE